MITRLRAQIGIGCLVSTGCFVALASASCANGGTVAGEASSTSAVAGTGGGDGGSGDGGDDEPKSSSKSSASHGDGDGDGGDGGGSDGGGSGDGGDASSTSATTSGTGDPCAIDSECFDADPCTLETCGGVSGCVQTLVAAGQAGTTEGTGCDGVCQGDGSCGLSLYERTFAAGQPFTRRALSQAWTGANAPPPRGISAVEHLYDRDVLIVFSEDGMTYIRDGGTWQEPLDTADAFPGVDASHIDCVLSFKPSAMALDFLSIYTGGAMHESWTFSFDEDDTPGFIAGPTPQTSGGGANEPPYGAADCDLGFVDQYAFQPATPWQDQWEGFQGNVFQFDSTARVWVAHGAQETSPLWASMPNGPAPSTTLDIYLDGTTLGFVAP